MKKYVVAIMIVLMTLSAGAAFASDSVQQSTERGNSSADVRGYFSPDDGSTAQPDSIDQSRENGGM